MKKIKLLELQNYYGKFEIITNKISEYKGVCGVWVMHNNHEQLLEVAQTADVFKELKYDLSWLLKDYSNEKDMRKNILQEHCLISIKNLMFFFVTRTERQPSTELSQKILKW